MLISRREILAVLTTGTCTCGQIALAEWLGIPAADRIPIAFVAPSRKDAELVIQLIHFTFAAADTDKAEALLRELRDASRKEEGVIGFDVARSVDKPNVFVLWEQYRDKAAQEAHIATEHFKRLVLDGVRVLAEQRNAEMLDPI